MPTYLRERFVDRVDELCWLARFSYEGLDTEKLARARNGTNGPIHGNVFSGTFLPDVCIDRHGETGFRHRPKSGYVDMGIRGDGELSYHVRNYRDPQSSAHDDHRWSDFAIPKRLREALKALAG